MARIRSTHPEQWTDEAFLTCSAFARLLAIGLRNEADDQGVFEWKPVTLKVRLLPLDNVEINELLSEVEATGQIKSFEFKGKLYGAIRNFRKWQRPQKPKNKYPLPDELRNYVGLGPSITEPVQHQSRTDTVISPQMKDVGGKRKEVKKKDNLKVIQKPKSSKGSRLPEGWKPSDQTQASAKILTAGGNIDIRWEFDKFTDYWLSKSGAGAVKIDWERTFLNWIRTAVERASPREPPPAKTAGGKQFLGPG